MDFVRRTATLLTAIAVAAISSIVVLAAPVAEAAPAGDDEVIAFEVRGVGNGHGRGMSQWGAFGRAIDGQGWQQILGTYYGGTQPGTRSEPNLRIRLTGWDGAGTVGVISTGGTARWNSNPTNYTSLHTVETAPNVFSVFGSTSERGCSGASALTIPRPPNCCVRKTIPSAPSVSRSKRIITRPTTATT